MKKELVKLWSVKVNEWGWSDPRRFYTPTREAAEKIHDFFTAADPVEYAGAYTIDEARKLLAYSKRYFYDAYVKVLMDVLEEDQC